jgi:hypothetical protein
VALSELQDIGYEFGCPAGIKITEWLRVVLRERQKPAEPAAPLIARARDEWHEDDGPVMWWAWCGHEWAGEPGWCGQPGDSDWPGYHTHWTPHPPMPVMSATSAEPAPSSREDVGIPKGWALDRLASGAILVRAPSLGFSARVVDVASRTESDRILFRLADALLGTEQPDWIAAAEAPTKEGE